MHLSWHFLFISTLVTQLPVGLSHYYQHLFQEYLQSMYHDTKNIQWEMELAILSLSLYKVIVAFSQKEALVP